MGEGIFPLFVAEGESEKKLAKIRRNKYLDNAYENFSDEMNEEDNCLFIFGHSLQENDKHILDKIVKGKIGKIYVGLFKTSGSSDDSKVQAKALDLKKQREEHDSSVPLEVVFFDSASAKVWEG